MIKLNKEKPTYGTTGRCYFKIVNKIAEIFIDTNGCGLADCEININYDVPDNTYNNKYAKKITKSEFNKVWVHYKKLIWGIKS